jgi:hypothetical protein
MAIGEKIFDEMGKVMSTSVKSVHPIEGVKMEVSFSSEVKGTGNFPSGKNLGSGMVTHYPHGTVDASYQGVFTANEGEQYIWWAHEKSRVTDEGKVKGVITVSGFTKSQKLSWMNDLIIVIDSEANPSSQEFKGVAYQWR